MILNAPELPRLMPEVEFAQYLGVSLHTVRRERWRGNLGYLRIGARIFYTAQHAIDYFTRQQVPPCNLETPTTSVKSAATGSRFEATARSGVELGSTPLPDRRAAHLLARQTFQMPSSD